MLRFKVWHILTNCSWTRLTSSLQWPVVSTRRPFQPIRRENSFGTLELTILTTKNTLNKITSVFWSKVRQQIRNEMQFVYMKQSDLELNCWLLSTATIAFHFTTNSTWATLLSYFHLTSSSIIKTRSSKAMNQNELSFSSRDFCVYQWL